MRMKNEKQIAIVDCYMFYVNVLVYFVNIEVVLRTCSNIKNIFHFSNPFLFFIFYIYKHQKTYQFYMIVEYFAKQKTRKHVQISIFFFHLQ